ncbi:MAG: glycosyltransferase family 4 protein [Desulfovibrio sp.]|jgi:glycosyltransferase involved in cell wall biosynthesis|nr:glycosyltransferase family 4 protein [Desulfovibrio sp.]
MKCKKIWGTVHPFYEEGSFLGRRVANQSFIGALLKANPFDSYHFFVGHPDFRDFLTERLKKDFPALYADGRFELYLHRELPYLLASKEYHCFHLSDCFVLFTELMQARNAYSRVWFPITAPTHSLSYSEYGQKFLHHMWSGVSSKDAVVATSQAGLAVVSNMYATLRRNYDLSEDQFIAPQVKFLPLGVDPEAMPNPEEKSKLGAAKRKELGLGNFLRKTDGAQADGEIIFLLFARLSYLSKMDLLPLLRAFKRAESLGLAPGSYRLLLAGWQDEDDCFAEEIKGFAKNLGIKCSFVLRPDHKERKALYAAADIFISPSDNLQETFGLTILEAAVSSLPIIASDFDGYKDLVIHGQTGLLTPTLGPASTLDTDVRSSFAPAGEYHLRLAQQCVVEQAPLAAAIATLALDHDLRCRMGETARKICLQEYSWDKIVVRYLDLWDTSAAMPISREEESRLRGATHPARLHYMEIFGGYYSSRLAEACKDGRKVRWSRAGEAVYRGKDNLVIYQLIEDSIQKENVKRMLFVARKPILLEQIRNISLSGPKQVSDKDFLLLWALKHDLLEFV